MSLTQYNLLTCFILKGQTRDYQLLFILRKEMKGKRTAKKGRLLSKLLKMKTMLTPRYFYNVFYPHLNPLSLRYLHGRYCSCHFTEGKTDTQSFSKWPKVTREV